MGIGILLEVIYWIFDLFFIMKLVGKGMGFGFLIVLGIVKGYGGVV